MARVSIDNEKCTGHGRCYALSPNVFEADDDGYGQLVDPSGAIDSDAARAAAQLGVDGCPENAITITD
jgi:ferredoxin